MTFCSFF